MPPDGRHVFFKGKVQMITYLRHFRFPYIFPILFRWKMPRLKKSRFLLRRTTAFHRRRLAFQIRTSAALSERLPKSLQHKGFPVVNAPKHNISYIPYPTAGMVNTGILYSLAARIRISGITLNLPCSRWKQRKPYHHIQIRKGSNHYGK